MLATTPRGDWKMRDQLSLYVYASTLKGRGLLPLPAMHHRVEPPINAGNPILISLHLLFRKPHALHKPSLPDLGVRNAGVLCEATIVRLLPKPGHGVAVGGHSGVVDVPPGHIQSHLLTSLTQS